jgi:RNA polymerase sigma factor (sigma-70 family)
MPVSQPLTPDKFEAILAWLGEDRERAAERYEQIREHLLRIFIWRGLDDAEGLADVTINRVADNVKNLRQNYVGDPALYFYGVAKRVIIEALREKDHFVPLPKDLPDPTPPTVVSEAKHAEAEHRHECFEECLLSLSPKNRELIQRYYLVDKWAKLVDRMKLAEELGISINNLRVRMHRIRKLLEECIIKCLEKSNGSE